MADLGDAPSAPDPKFSQFHAFFFFWKILQNRMKEPSGGLAPSYREYWNRLCKCFIFKICAVLNQFYFRIFTGRNEVVAKVMFLLLSVILLTGGHV